MASNPTVDEQAALHAELRSAVRKLCERFPDEYWRELDTSGGYPTDFLKEMTDAGFLGALIPPE